MLAESCGVGVLGVTGLEAGDVVTDEAGNSKLAPHSPNLGRKYSLVPFDDLSEIVGF